MLLVKMREKMKGKYKIVKDGYWFVIDPRGQRYGWKTWLGAICFVQYCRGWEAGRIFEREIA